jgi:hypothetical protein
MKTRVYSSLGLIFAVGLMSGCSGNDTVPIIPPSGPVAMVDDLRTPKSDALTSEEAALVSQADSDPDPAPLPDL